MYVVKSAIHTYYFILLLSFFIVQGRDYTLNDRALNFGACSKKECLTVDIIDDDLIEDTETFTITLQPPSQDFTERIILSPNVTTVTIEDEDSKFPDLSLVFYSVFFLPVVAIVTFDRTEYIVQETSSSLTVCARVISPRVSCPVTIPFSLTLIVSDNTACNDCTRIYLLPVSHCILLSLQ